MRKKLELTEFELSFNFILREMNECFCSYTPKYIRLKKILTNHISNIDFIKNLSYTFKLEIDELISQYPVPESVTFEINSYIYYLECNLVNLSKYNDKFQTMSSWFTSYANLKSFIIQNSTTNYVYAHDMPEPVVELSMTHEDTKIIKFNHLL